MAVSGRGWSVLPLIAAVADRAIGEAPSHSDGGARNVLRVKQGFQLCGTEHLAILQGAEPVGDHLAGAGVAALLNLALDELLEMPLHMARRRGALPVAWP
jgi:hypothetical protein